MRIALTGGIACGKSLLARYLSQMGVRIIDADDVVHELEAPGGEAVAPIVERFGPEVLAPDGGIDRQVLAKYVFGGEELRVKSEKLKVKSEAHPQLLTLNSQLLTLESEAHPQLLTLNSQLLTCKARADLESILFPLVRKRIADFFDDGSTIDNRQTTCERQSTPDNRQSASPSQLLTFNFQLLTSPSKPIPSNSQISLSIIPLLFESHWETEYDIIISLISEHETQVRRMAETRGMSREQAEARIAAQMPVAEKAARANYVIENNSTPDALHAEAVRLLEWLQSMIRG